jgi:uroporphyrinogen decarboxylase
MATESMSSRERVARAFEHKEPDRVPIDLGSRGSGLGLQVYEEFKQAMGVSSRTEVLDHRLGLAVIDEKILRHFNVDTRYVYMRASKNWDPQTNTAEDTFIDEWGAKLKRPQGGFYYDHVESPIKEPSLDAIKLHKWPDPSDKSRVQGAAEEARKYYEQGYAVGTYMKGIWETSWIVRGIENCMTDMYVNKEFYHYLLDRIADVIEEELSLFLDEIGPYLSFACVTEDLGTQLNLMISPQSYKEFIRPRTMRLFEVVRKKSKAKIAQHSCGAIFPLIPELIAAGVEMLNPVQVSARGMDTRLLKQEYGKDIIFWGGIDSQKILINGTADMVEEEVKRVLHDLAPGGGYLIAPTHDIQNFTPTRNIIALYDAANKYGWY